MDTSEFVRRYPSLFHLAHDEAWPSILDRGLLSASALVAACQVPPPRAEALLTQRRLAPETVEHPSFGRAVLRDQSPLHEGKLQTALTDGLTVADWLKILNGFVFFCPTRASLETLYKSYSAEPVVVVEVRTSSLAASYRSLLRVTTINTGASLYKPASRGVSTFLPIGRLDGKRTVKEVAIDTAVPDLAAHLLTVERWLPDGTRTKLYPDADGPDAD